jgi:NADH-quinone oxidoreductase subunit M
MPELHLPWLTLAIATPLVGALLIYRVRDSELAWNRSLIATGFTLFLTLGAWLDFALLNVFEAHDRGDIVSTVLGDDAVVIDEFSAPLLPLAALLYFAVVVATLRTRIRRFPFAWALVALSLLVALLCCRQPWGVIVLLAAQSLPPWMELRFRGRSTRTFLLHTLLSIGLLAAGWAMCDAATMQNKPSLLAMAMLTTGILIRHGIAPFHCWMTDLFENVKFGTALLYVLPMSGAYAAVRLVLPVAPDGALRCLAIAALATAVYSAGMALVQHEARRFFCYLFLSNSALVLVGLDGATPIRLTGGLCLWISVGLSLGGLGLTLRALESRTGRLSLAGYHGLYEQMPNLAAFFLLTGLASIGFPGTIGFVGAELLVEGAVNVSAMEGMLVLAVAALNGIAVLQVYFRLFTGTRHVTSISLRGRWPERAAVMLLTALILGGGLIPQPGVANRYHAASEILSRRQRTLKPSDVAPVSQNTARHAINNVAK